MNKIFRGFTAILYKEFIVVLRETPACTMPEVVDN